jgi:hypothetical protein
MDQSDLVLPGMGRYLIVGRYFLLTGNNKDPPCSAYLKLFSLNVNIHTELVILLSDVFLFLQAGD